MAVEFLIGGMLGRIAGPIAQDLFEYKTPLGREMAQKKLEKQRQMSQIELDNKLKLSQLDNESKMHQLQQQFEDKLKASENQMMLSYSEWQQKMFWDKCFPLRNPFEVPMGYELIYDESNKRLQGCKLNKLVLPNSKQIVPLRVITALKDSTNDQASTINTNMSMFLVNYYSANGEHAVVSEIGAWKEDSPVNDASVNYLFKGLRGQPTLVLVPVYTNGTSQIRLKMWSWGLGESLQYPVGFDFGSIDLESIRRQALIDTLNTFKSAIDKTNFPFSDKSIDNSFRFSEKLNDFRSQLSIEEIECMSLLLPEPELLKKQVQKKTNEIVSTIFSCMTAMYTDGYHLIEYGTVPILPYVLPKMYGSNNVLPYIRDYYVTIANAAMIKGVISPVEVAKFELDLLESIKMVDSDSNGYSSLKKHIRGLLFDLKESGKIPSTTIAMLENKTKVL